MPASSSSRTPQSSPPATANIASKNLTVSGGIAIFHLATARVVICYHTRDKYWFLPKGRKNVHEDILTAAEREGFEESGFRNRVLALPMDHGQTEADEAAEREQVFVKEPVWTQMVPLRPGSRRQYLLFWFVGETVPAEVEEDMDRSGRVGDGGRVYKPPPSFTVDMTIHERIEMDTMVGEDGKRRIYEPVRHEGTGVDEEEALYTSELVPVEDAIKKLRGSLMADVVRRGWEAIQLRIKMEDEALKAGA